MPQERPNALNGDRIVGLAFPFLGQSQQGRRGMSLALRQQLFVLFRRVRPEHGIQLLVQQWLGRSAIRQKVLEEGLPALGFQDVVPEGFCL